MMWETFKQSSVQHAQTAVASLFCLLVFTLVLIHIFGLEASDIKGFFRSNMPKAEIQKPVPKKKSGGDEIRKYTEFVTINHKVLKLKITTGTQFDNSTNQNVELQWCYAFLHKSKKDGFVVRLEIQEIENSVIKSFAPYSVQTLLEFGLTQTQAKDLITYCRFR